MHKTRADLGAIAQLGERLLCKQEVVGSIPSGSTKFSQITSRSIIRLPHYGWWFLCASCLHRLFERSAIEGYANLVVEIIKNNSPPTTLSIIPFIGTLSFVL